MSLHCRSGRGRWQHGEILHVVVAAAEACTDEFEIAVHFPPGKHFANLGYELSSPEMSAKQLQFLDVFPRRLSIVADRSVDDGHIFFGQLLRPLQRCRRETKLPQRRDSPLTIAQPRHDMFL